MSTPIASYHDHEGNAKAFAVPRMPKLPKQPEKAADKKSRKGRYFVIGLAIGCAVFGISKAVSGGSSTPATLSASITKGGTYTAGKDIVPGSWRITKGIGTVDHPCKWYVYDANDHLLTSSATEAAGKGISVPAGADLISINCGTWRVN